MDLTLFQLFVHGFPEKLAKSIKNRQIYFKIQYKMELKSAKIALWDPLGATLSKTPRVDVSRVRPGPSQRRPSTPQPLPKSG